MLLSFIIVIMSLIHGLFCSSQVVNNSGVLINFQIQGYSNPDSLLPGGNTCLCPNGFHCEEVLFVKCMFGFAFVFATDDGNVHYVETEFFDVEDGSLMKELEDLWNQTYAVRLSTKPSSLAIIVFNRGHVYSLNGKLQLYHGAVHADRFVIPLLDILPTIPGAQNVTYNQIHKGNLIGTSLNLTYSIECVGELIGLSCDLNCTKSQIDSNVAQCLSVKAGYTSICHYTPDGQVDQCKQCLWGVRNGTSCRTENEWKMIAWIFMGVSAMLAGLLGFVMFYRPDTKKIDNLFFEFLCIC